MIFNLSLKTSKSSKCISHFDFHTAQCIGLMLLANNPSSKKWNKKQWWVNLFQLNLQYLAKKYIQWTKPKNRKKKTHTKKQTIKKGWRILPLKEGPVTPTRTAFASPSRIAIARASKPTTWATICNRWNAKTINTQLPKSNFRTTQILKNRSMTKIRSIRSQRTRWTAPERCNLSLVCRSTNLLASVRNGFARESQETGQEWGFVSER